MLRAVTFVVNSLISNACNHDIGNADWCKMIFNLIKCSCMIFLARVTGPGTAMYNTQYIMKRSFKRHIFNISDKNGDTYTILMA